MIKEALLECSSKGIITLSFDGEKLELIDSYIEDNPPKDNNEAVWYLGESLKKLVQKLHPICNDAMPTI
jgi:hypothetical protein